MAKRLLVDFMNVQWVSKTVLLEVLYEHACNRLQLHTCMHAHVHTCIIY